MRRALHSPPIQKLIQLLSKMPGLGPRSGRRAALYLLQNKIAMLHPLMNVLEEVSVSITFCESCGNLDVQPLCTICRSADRDRHALCILAGVDDLWALERAGAYKGLYHVLGGVLSALDGIGPDQLRLKQLQHRLEKENIQEIIIALGATLEGQTTAHYVADIIKPYNLKVTRLAHGVPIGGELDYLDEGTIVAALQARCPFI